MANPNVDFDWVRGGRFSYVIGPRRTYFIHFDINVEYYVDKFFWFWIPWLRFGFAEEKKIKCCGVHILIFLIKTCLILIGELYLIFNSPIILVFVTLSYSFLQFSPLIIIFSNFVLHLKFFTT